MRIGIIGGGVYGSAIAYFLAEFGDEDVVLFERERLGGESTSRSAGIVRHHYSRREQIQLAKRGREIIESLESRVGQDGGFHQNGYLALSGLDTEEEFRNTVEMQREIGLDVELLSPNELDEHFPGIDSTGIVVGAIEYESGFADPYLVATGFANRAADLGVELQTGTEVLGIEQSDGHITAVDTGTGTEPLDYLVNAAGPWGAHIGEMVGVTLPLTWHESKVVVLSGPKPYGTSLPTISDAIQHMYVKPEPGGDFIVGGITRPQIDPETGLEGVDIQYLNAVEAALERRLPEYADSRVVETWSGIITATPDWNQIVGVPAGFENLYNIVGASGHGFKEAPAFAESIAQEILGRKPRQDLTSYRLERFEEGELLGGLEKKRKET